MPENDTDSENLKLASRITVDLIKSINNEVGKYSIIFQRTNNKYQSIFHINLLKFFILFLHQSEKITLSKEGQALSFSPLINLYQVLKVPIFLREVNPL